MGLWCGDVNAINTCKKMWNAIIRKNGNLPLRQTLLPLSTTRGTPKAVVNLKCSFTSLQRFRSLFSDLVSQISGVCFLFFSFPRCSQWPIAKQTWLLSAIKNIILCIYLHLVTFPPFFFLVFIILLLISVVNLWQDVRASLTRSPVYLRWFDS